VVRKIRFIIVKSLTVIIFSVLFVCMGVFSDFVVEMVTDRPLEDISLTYLLLVWIVLVALLHILITLFFKGLARKFDNLSKLNYHFLDLSTPFFSLGIVVIGYYIVFEERTRIHHLTVLLFGLSMLLVIGSQFIKRTNS